MACAAARTSAPARTMRGSPEDSNPLPACMPLRTPAHIMIQRCVISREAHFGRWRALAGSLWPSEEELQVGTRPATAGFMGMASEFSAGA